MEKIKEILENFGLTARESEIYIYLGRNGRLKGCEIARKLRIHKGQVYRILRRLQNMGLVEVTLEIPAQFSAVSFAKIIDSKIRAISEDATLLKHSRKDLLQNWSNIYIPKISTIDERLMIIEGHQNTYPRIFQMIAEAEKEVLLMISGATPTEILLREIYNALFKKVKKSGIQVRILTQSLEKNDDAIQQKYQKVFRQNLEDYIQWMHLKTGLTLQSRFFIKDAKEILLFTKLPKIQLASNLEETCIWTNCNAIIDLISVLFEELWCTSFEIQEALMSS